MTDKFALLQRQVHQGQPHYRPAPRAAAASAPAGAAQQQQQPALPLESSSND